MTDPFTITNSFDMLDAIAVIGFVLAWIAIGWRIENPKESHISVSRLMDGYRRLWMREMVTRQPRVFDAQLLSTLRQGPSFFASATLIALGGGLALMGNTERLNALYGELQIENAPTLFLEAKLGLLVIVLVNSFLKYVWSHRLFGYCSILMGAVPNDLDDADCYKRADQAADLCISAARSFNRGLRATYFGLAATAWLLGAIPLIVATCVTFGVLWRREFSSRSRQVILDNAPSTKT